jgi:uncharacterized protein
MSYVIDEILASFVKESVKSFDESHDYQHALQVTHTAHLIMQNLKGDSYEKQMLSYMAMLHDVRDHKYPNSISEEQLVDFVAKQLGSEKMMIVMAVINNISWSKEVSGRQIVPPEPWNEYLTVVADADRLEAIGKIGIRRCTIFTQSKNPSATPNEVLEDVITHCREKLLRLYTDNFIKMPYARELAEPLHQEIVDFVNNPVL